MAGQTRTAKSRRRAAIVFALALPLADLCGFCATAGYAQTTFRHFADADLEAKLAAAKIRFALAACPGGLPVRGRGCYRQPGSVAAVTPRPRSPWKGLIVARRAKFAVRHQERVVKRAVREM